MKMVLLKVLFQFFCMNATAQSQQEPGVITRLIYDSLDLKKIIPAIDSFNAAIPENKYIKHNGIKQARAVYFHLGNLNSLNAVLDLQKNMPLEKFIRKYPKTKVIRDVLVIQEPYTDFEGTPAVMFTYIDPPANDRYQDFYVHDLKELPANYKKDQIKEWGHDDHNSRELPVNYKEKIVFNYHGGYNNPDYNFIDGFYFQEDFISPEIPEKYSAMINYKETIFDDAFPVYSTEDRTGYYSQFETKYREVDSFSILVMDKFDIKPGMRGATKDNYINSYNYSDEHSIKKNIDSGKIQRIRDWLLSFCMMNELFQRAIDSAINNHHSNNMFEYLTGQLVSLEKELAIKRGRLPDRSCGNDNAPKIRDYAIASLALKTGNLKLFLHAHEYVIRGGRGNGDFRDSYIEELDFIHIPGEKYFMGSYLSTSEKNNAAWNRYGKCYELYGAKDRNKIESVILEAISDNQLDNFNRISLAKLFARYCLKEKDETKKQNNISRLNNAVQELPACIRFSYAIYVGSLNKY